MSDRRKRLVVKIWRPGKTTQTLFFGNHKLVSVSIIFFWQEAKRKKTEACKAAAKKRASAKAKSKAAAKKKASPKAKSKAAAKKKASAKAKSKAAAKKKASAKAKSKAAAKKKASPKAKSKAGSDDTAKKLHSAT